MKMNSGVNTSMLFAMYDLKAQIDSSSTRMLAKKQATNGKIKSC